MLKIKRLGSVSGILPQIWISVFPSHKYLNFPVNRAQACALAWVILGMGGIKNKREAHFSLTPLLTVPGRIFRLFKACRLSSTLNLPVV